MIPEPRELRKRRKLQFDSTTNSRFSSGPAIALIGILFTIAALAKFDTSFVVVLVLIICGISLILAGVNTYLRDKKSD